MICTRGLHRLQSLAPLVFGLAIASAHAAGHAALASLCLDIDWSPKIVPTATPATPRPIDANPTIFCVLVPGLLACLLLAAALTLPLLLPAIPFLLLGSVFRLVRRVRA